MSSITRTTQPYEIINAKRKLDENDKGHEKRKSNMAQKQYCTSKQEQKKKKKKKENNIHATHTNGIVDINTLPLPPFTFFFHTPSEMMLPMLNTLFLPPRPSCSNGARESWIMGYPPLTDTDGNGGEEGDDDDEPVLVPPPTPPAACLSGAR